MNTINIIGMGLGKKDLTQKHLSLIHQCDILIGGRRHLELFDTLEVQKIPVTASIKSVVEAIKEKMGSKKIVVLASGDPLFYGIGSTLTQYFDKKNLTIHSNISSVSAAFAAIKQPWHDARIISLHGKQKKAFSFSKLAGENKIVFLTDPQMDPHYIADGLIKKNMLAYRCCVLERLGDAEKEKITWFETPSQIGKQTFSHPNIVILQKQQKEKTIFPHETHLGMKESAFKHSKGLITKSEIRSITLSKLKLIRKDHILWDIGAGSGSVGIEASFQIPQGRVYAIEKHPTRILDIEHNINTFGCPNVEILTAAFPKGIETLKTPDRIFIGGGGERLGKIIKIACSRLAVNGVIVVNTVLLQNLETTLSLLKDYNFAPHMVHIQISRSKGMPFGDRLEALNPVWIISGSKPEPR